MDKNLETVLRKASCNEEKGTKKEVGVETGTMKEYERTIPKDEEEDDEVKWEDNSNSPKNVKEMQRVDLDCLVLAECTQEKIPAHVTQILQFYDPILFQPWEIIFILVYISAIENGYVTEQDYNTMLDELEIPAYGMNYFQATNIMKLTKKLPAYESHNGKSMFTMKLVLLEQLTPNIDKCLLKVMLTAIVTTECMIVTLSPASKCSKMTGCSTVVAIDRYIITSPKEVRPIQKRFRKINELAKTIAHDIFVPMRAQQNTMLGKYPDAFLNRLPPELYAHILQYVKNEDEANLSLVLKKLLLMMLVMVLFVDLFWLFFSCVVS